MTKSPKSVLFLCVENSNRSQMAEAFARMLAGDDVVAYSAGSNPSGTVNPKAISAMGSLGYDLTTHTSKSIADLPNITFDFVATMGCGDSCGVVRSKQNADWQIPDPRDLSEEAFHDIRDRIGAKVRDQLQQLGVLPER